MTEKNNNKLNVGPYMATSELKETKEDLQIKLMLLNKLKKERKIREEKTVAFEYQAPKVGPYMPEVYEIFMPEDDTYIKRPR